MFFDSLFKKIISIFIIILLIGFTITGVVLYTFLDGYASEQKQNLLNYTSDKVVELFNLLLPNLEDALIQQIFRKNLEAYSNNTNADIWIINSKGIIVYAYSTNVRLRAFEGKALNEQQTKEVLAGNKKTDIGNFHGLFNQQYLTIQKPLLLDKAVIGAIYLHTPVPELEKLKSDVFKLFLLSAFISILIAMGFAYFFSKRISMPLKQISDAAKVIADGEFQKRLDIKSYDEIGELAASFNSMAIALESLENMRREFIGNISHELRTPMTSIRGFIQGILDQTIPTERHQTYLNIVKDEVERLNRLVNDLLDLAKMQSGEMGLTKREFNINELIRRTVVKLESDIIRKSIEVEAFFVDDEPHAFADSDAIERVVINLLHNAIKFTPEGGTIKVTTTLEKDVLYVSIEDTGIGINADEINSIWERFYKSDKSRGMDKSGTGIGLAIVKNIINSHGERIWVQSESGKGTKFTFTLPVSTE